MATIQLYVRADGNDTNDGLTNSSGGAKLTAQSAWLEIPADPTDNYVINIIGAFNASNGTGTLNLAVSNSNNATFRITSDSAGQVTQPTDAEFDASARIDTSADPAIGIGTTNVTIEKIGVRSTDGAGNPISVGANNATLRNLILIGGSANYAIRNGATGVYVVNVAAWAGGGVRNAGTATYDFVSVLTTGGIAGFLNKSGATGVVNGCIAQETSGGTGFADEGDAWTGNYNVSHDTSGPGAGSLDNATGVFASESGGSEDLTLTSSSAYDIVDRTGLSADTDTDIAGTSRPSTGADAGVWQNPAAPPATILPLVACDMNNIDDMGEMRG